MSSSGLQGLMQARAKLQIMIGVAASLAVAPPFLLAAESPTSSSLRHEPTLLSGSWLRLAAERVTPGYQWVDVQSLPPMTPLSPVLGLSVDEVFLVPVVGTDRWQAALRLSRSNLAGALVAPSTASQLDGTGFERRYWLSGLDLGTANGLRVSADAVFASQRFASGSLAPPFASDWLASQDPVGLVDQSQGTGLALSLGGPLPASGLGWVAGVRSKVDMDAFKHYRGVYSEPGDLDIPATAALGITANLGGAAELVLGAEHVFYSDVSSFSSYVLPNRFLSLLGDSTSPEFRWRDLTVYSAGLQGRAPDWNWSLRYSTSLQPDPTAGLLQQAIDSIQSNSNWSLGFTRQLSQLGELRLTASYAGAEYVLGTPYYRSNKVGDSTHFEFEALWQVRF